MVGLFDSSKVYTSLHITLPSEKLEFKNIEDLKKYALAGKITKWHIYFAEDSLTTDTRNVLTIRSGSLMGSTLSEVHATSHTEAWCAGANEVVYSFLQSHKVWYHWFLAAPLGVILLVLVNTWSVGRILFPKEIVDKASFIIGWLTITGVFAILYFAKGKLLPSATIRITEEQNFIRRNVSELTLIVTIIALVVAVLQFFK